MHYVSCKYVLLSCQPYTNFEIIFSQTVVACLLTTSKGDRRQASLGGRGGWRPASLLRHRTWQTKRIRLFSDVKLLPKESAQQFYGFSRERTKNYMKRRCLDQILFYSFVSKRARVKRAEGNPSTMLANIQPLGSPAFFTTEIIARHV